MNVIETRLPGVVVIEPRVFRDDRGYFLETWSAAAFGARGLPVAFAQDNRSSSAPGVLRGLHYQFPAAQGKLVGVSRGSVFDVAVDIRVGSPTFGAWEGVTLSADDGRQLYIPPGFAHGFLVVGDEPAMFTYKCTEAYDPAGQCSIRWDDPEIGIDWPGARPRLSPKDAEAPRLREVAESPPPPSARSLKPPEAVPPMPEAIPIVLWSWVPVSLLLFWRLGPARAAVACLLGGWLLLPTARFDGGAAVAFPYWIMPACLPSDLWATKARVVGVAGLLGVMAFDFGAWRRLRFSAFDLPMVGWCLVPIASGLANGRGPAASAADAAYLAEAWGVPYLLGRLYFGHPAGLAELARGVVVGGLACLPFCAIELFTGPLFYEKLYGFHPYQHDGAARYLGSRPIALLEHGNQLGIWLASSALVAAWLWRSGGLRRVLGLPGGAVAALLVAQAVAAQSAGAVVLLVAGLAAIELVRRVGRTWPLVAALAVVLAFVGARAANLFDAKALAMRTAVGRRLVDASTRLDRRSMGWRLRVEERAARVALRRPALGTGGWDWWRAGVEGERPWGLPGLVLGMYGVAGWALLLGCFLAPMAAFLGAGPPRYWATPTRAPAAAMAGALALIGIDAILNSFVFLPTFAAAGGLVGLRGHASASSAWLLRAVASHP